LEQRNAPLTLTNAYILIYTAFMKSGKSMAKIPRKTNCCGFDWVDENPLVLKAWGAECSKCKTPYLADVIDECPHCGTTELLCGHHGQNGCQSNLKE
jgi:hypothetical protein